MCFFRGEKLWRQQVRPGYAGGVLAQLHVGDVQQPARQVVLGVALQQRRQVANGALCTARQGVDAARANGKDARVLAMVCEAVFGFAQPQPGDGPQVQQVAHGCRWQVHLLGQGERAVQRVQCSVGVAGAQLLRGQLLPHGKFVSCRQRMFAQQAIIVRGTLPGFVGVALPVRRAIDTTQPLTHGHVAVWRGGCLCTRDSTQGEGGKNDGTEQEHTKGVEPLQHAPSTRPLYSP